MKFVYLVLLCILASMTIVESRRRSHRGVKWDKFKSKVKSIAGKAGRAIKKGAKLAWENRDKIIAAGKAVAGAVAGGEAPAAGGEAPAPEGRRRRYH